MDDDDVVGAVHADVIGIVDQRVAIQLLDDLEAIVRRHVVGLDERLLHAVGDGVDMGRRFALDEGDAHEGHGNLLGVGESYLARKTPTVATAMPTI